MHLLTIIPHPTPKPRTFDVLFAIGKNERPSVPKVAPTRGPTWHQAHSPRRSSDAIRETISHFHPSSFLFEVELSLISI